MPERSARRMPLRELVTHAEKCSRDLIEHMRAGLWSRVSEFRDLSRPVRRHSHYPTFLALLNALDKMQQAAEETKTLAHSLQEQLEEIRERARRERMSGS